MVLTEKQKEELHKALLEYFRVSGFEKTFQAFKDEAKVDGNNLPTDGALERKWTSVIRLQKKLDELNKVIEQMKAESGSIGKMKLLGKDGFSDHLLQVPEKNILAGHRGQIIRVLFHPVYSLLLSASEDASIRIWDIETGKMERSLKGHTGTINNLAFNSTGTLLASCSSDLSVKLWNFETFDCIKTFLGHEHNVTGVDFVGGGSDYIVSSSRDKTVKVWELSTGFCVRTYTGHGDWVRKVLIHPKLPLMLTCSYDKTVMIWEADASKMKVTSAVLMPPVTFSEHEHVIEAICFANELAAEEICKSEYYGSKMGKLSLASTASELPEEDKSGSGSSSGPIINPGTLVSKKPSGGVQKVFFASGGRDKLIKIWEMKEQKSIITLVGHDNWVRDLAFHPNGKFLISTSDDKSIRIWDLRTGRCIKNISEAHSHFVTCIDLSGKYLMAASGSVDNSVKLWDCR